MKKLLLVLALIGIIVLTAYGALSGTYTTNGYFYLPGYGAYGVAEWEEYNTYMQTADTQIEANKDTIAAKVSDLIYGAGWDGVTTIAPSKNVIYDKIESIGSGHTQEEIEDYAGVMWTGNTETRITIGYMDVDGTIDAVVDDNLDDYDNSISMFVSDLDACENIEGTHLDIAALTLNVVDIGIADNDLLEVDGLSNVNEYARFTANGLVGRTEAEFKGDFNLEIGTDVQAHDADLDDFVTWAGGGWGTGRVITFNGPEGEPIYPDVQVFDSVDDMFILYERGGLEDDVSAYDGLIKITGGATSNLTIGIANDNIVEIDDADAAANDYCKLTANGIVGRSYAEVISDIGAEGDLSNEAGLYAALSDVSDFVQADEANSIDSAMYVDGSIDHEHLAPDVISGMTDVTSADADYILIWDATDSALKKVDMGEVRGAGGASQLSDLSDVHTSTVTDKFVLVADGVDFESRALVEADISDLGTAAALVADKLDVFAATTEAELYTVLSDVAQFYESGDKVGDADTLDTHDTSYFQIALTDEASLYAALSDVTQFYESGDKVGDADTLDTHDTSYFQIDLTNEASLYTALSDVTMFLEDTIDDTSPELGGEMDAGAHSIGFTVQTITSTAGTATIDWGNSNKARITLSENTTLAFTNPAYSGNYMLIIIQPAGGNEYTTTFPAGIYWASGTKVSVPVTNGNRCIVSFVFDDEDSDNWYCQGTETFATDD